MTRLIDADFEEQHYASMLLNPSPEVTAKDKEDARIILDALKMAKTVSADEQIQSMVEKRVAELVHLNHELEQQLADRPHGEWEHHAIVTASDTPMHHIWKCNRCEYEGNPDMNFCPNCGALMGGDGE